MGQRHVAGTKQVVLAQDCNGVSELMAAGIYVTALY